MEERKYTSGEVATMLGIKRQHLIVVITRHPEFRPKTKIEATRYSAYLWTQEEIEAVTQYINRNKK